VAPHTELLGLNECDGSGRRDWMLLIALSNSKSCASSSGVSPDESTSVNRAFPLPDELAEVSLRE